MVTRFVVGGYESDRGSDFVFRISVAEETLTLSIDTVGNNSFSNRPITVPLFAYSNAERRKLGIHARGVYLRYVSQAPGPQFSSPSFFVPVFRAFLWRRMLAGQTGVYRGQQVMITGVIPEAIRN